MNHTPPEEQHVHRYVFPAPNGRAVIIGVCSCTQTRAGFAHWEEARPGAGKYNSMPIGRQRPAIPEPLMTDGTW